MAKGIYERKGKNGDVTYYVRYQFKTMDEQGNEIMKDLKEKVGRKSRGFTRELAKEALKAREGEIAQGRFNLEKVKKPHLIAELLQRYHKHAESYKESYSRERYALEGFKKYFGGRYLSDITTWGVEKWKRDREKQVQKSTVNRELTVLKHMLKMGVKWGLMASNPAAGVSPYPVQEGRFRYLAEEEIPTLLEACEKQVTSPWLYPLVVLALNTGARQGELAELRFEDLDLGRNLIYFGRTKNRKLKTVPMNQAVREVVDWLSNHRYGEYLFMWPWGERVGRTTIYDAFKAVCRAAGIEKFRFHDLRHTAASYLVMEGVDLPTVKEILGHREIEMTLRYSHLAPAHKAKAMDKLGCVLEKLTKAEKVETEAELKAENAPALAANMAQIRNVFLVRSGRGLAVVQPKSEESQDVNRSGNWWRRGESNPRPKILRRKRLHA
jgi:integrase